MSVSVSVDPCNQPSKKEDYPIASLTNRQSLLGTRMMNDLVLYRKRCCRDMMHCINIKGPCAMHCINIKGLHAVHCIQFIALAVPLKYSLNN